MLNPVDAQASLASSWFNHHGLLAVLLVAFLASCAPPAPLPKGKPGQSVAVATRESPAQPGPRITPTPLGLPGTLATEVQTEEVSAQVAALAKEVVQGHSGERDKALALYDWIAKNIRYDIAAYLAKDLPDPSPDVVLSTRLTVCEGYARLFMAMAHSVGLEAVMVPGNSKGFAPDEDNSEPDHAWNAVKLDGNWVLLDPTWGAGHIDESKAFVAEFTRDWFDVPPQQFACSHLPVEPKWQLLSSPLSAEVFWAQPSLSHLYFDYELSLDSHAKGKISTDGPFELRFSAGKECRLMASLYRDDQQLAGNHALVERRGRDFTVSVAPPEAGDYRLVVFAGPPDDSRTESAVTYQLQATSGSAEVFPKTLQTFADEEVRLLSPRSGLQRGQSTELVVEAPGATKLMAVAGEEQIHFEHDGDRFTAVVTPEHDKITVFGSYDESLKYDGLLEFPVSP